MSITGATEHSLSLKLLGATDSKGKLTSFTAPQIKTLAASDVAYRFALVNLLSYAVLGADYQKFNKEGELDIYDPATGKGQLSLKYIEDKSKFLALKNMVSLDHKNNPNPDAIRYVQKGENGSADIVVKGKAVIGCLLF